MLIPNKGRLVSNKGNTMQCTAQASEVAIPSPSQFIFAFILNSKDTIFALTLQILSTLNEVL